MEAAVTGQVRGIRVGRLVHAGGRTVHVLESGSGPPCVLLHGLGGLAQEILAPLEPLAGRFRLVAPDRPGYGWSDPLPPSDMTPAGQAAWLGRLLDRLGVRRCRLVAHSIGSATALCFALARPRQVDGLMLLAPFCRPTRPAAMPLLRLAVAPVVGVPVRHWLVPALADRLARPRLAGLFAPDPVPDCFTGFPVAHAAGPAALEAMAAELRGFNTAMIPAALRLRRLRLPVTVVAGTADPVADTDRHARWLAARLPRARLALLDGVGHMPHHVRPGPVMALV